MRARAICVVFGLTLTLGACGGSPDDSPASDQGDMIDSGPTAVLDQARTVANDLEQRTQDIESQLRDPFARP